MISVFQIDDSFNYADGRCLIERNYQLMRDAFPHLLVEFFYYIKASDPERFFIVRVRHAPTEQFAETGIIFAGNLGFTKLDVFQAKEFLRTTPALDTYE